ncbi:MAG: ferric reductase-like transmembrane domain-containing protein [Proteobacteria bacterium]|nr:ferric reductase-like transmembrane domain-containing protein [Pseudomonadota bacterium]
MPHVMDPQERAESVELKIYRSLVIGFLLLVMGGALSIPFVYESQTLWYQLGIKKIMLRGGQMAGLLAATLLFVQILLAARGKLLKKLFGVAALMRWHRTNGIIVSLLAVIHVMLVLAPEGVANLPISKKYWPEMVGIALLWIILSMAISSRFREKLGLDYKKWRIIHKMLGYLVVLLIAVHVLFVSDSFEHAIPRAALFTSFLGVLLSVVLNKIASGSSKL